MRKRLVGAIAVLLLMGLTSIGFAAAAGKVPKPTVVRAGNMVLALNGDIAPKALPEHRFAPLGFWSSDKLTTVDGSHPPALESGAVDVNRNVIVDVKGLPACRIEQLWARETKAAESACGDAILGRGSVTVEVAFPEQRPFDSTGPMILFNGGERNGVVTVLAYVYVSVPAPTAVIATVEVRRVPGAHGLHIEIEVPKIAGGAGSPVAGRFWMRRVYSYKGKRRSVISARCPSGHIQGRGTFTYSDETVLSGSVIRACRALD